MYKILALFGKSGAGKDTIQKWYASNADVNEIVSATTRPPREYEQDSVDYYFLTEEQFADKVLDATMLEATSFRSWFYGTPIDSLREDKINVGVFNITGISILLTDERVQVLPVYVDCSNKARLLRILNREQSPDCEEICRRYLADEQDFADIEFQYETVGNTNQLDTTTLREFLDELAED